MKTLFMGIGGVAICIAVDASAQHLPQTPEARLALFAQCAGRFSAQMEHEWLVGHDGAKSEMGRAHMVALIDAVGPHSNVTGIQILAWRIDSKVAHAALLSRATFQQHPHAQRLARHHIATCAALLPQELELVALR